VISIRVLVTGGSGLLGVKIAEVGKKYGHQIILGFNSHPVDQVESLKLDVTNVSEASRAFIQVKPDAVIHAAALTDVDRCEREQGLAYKINVDGTRNIVNFSNKFESSLVLISTDYVFSGEKGNYSENDETSPINFYGHSKRDAEKEVISYSRDWCVVRPSVIFGSTPAAGKVNFVLWLLNKLKNGEQVRIVTDQWVSPTLNTNLAEMIFNMIGNKQSGVFHLSGASQISRYDFALEIAEKFNLEKSLIKPVTSKEMNWVAKRPINSSLNVEKAERILHVKPLKICEALSLLKIDMELNVKN